MRRLQEFRDTCATIKLTGRSATFEMDNSFSVGTREDGGGAIIELSMPARAQIIARYTKTHSGLPFDEWTADHIDEVLQIARKPGLASGRSDVFDQYMRESRESKEWNTSVAPRAPDERLPSIEIAQIEGKIQITGSQADFSAIETALARLREGRRVGCSNDGNILIVARENQLLAPQDSAKSAKPLELAMRSPACALPPSMVLYYVARSFGASVIVNTFGVCVDTKTGEPYRLTDDIVNGLCEEFGIIAWSDENASYAEYHRALGKQTANHPDGPLYSGRTRAPRGEEMLAAARKYCELFYRRNSFIDFTSPVWDGRLEI